MGVTDRPYPLLRPPANDLTELSARQCLAAGWAARPRWVRPARRLDADLSTGRRACPPPTGRPDLAERGVGQRAVVALGLLDTWLSGHDQNAPAQLGDRVRLPAGHWLGERAATDILVLARKGRAFSSLNTLIARQGGQHVLYGSALALTAATQAWSASTDTPVPDLTPEIVH